MEILWLTAATPSYRGEVQRLERSFRKHCRQQSFLVETLPEPFVHTGKFPIIRKVSEQYPDLYVVWIDADCELLEHISYAEISSGKPLCSVRHFQAESLQHLIPSHAHSFIKPGFQLPYVQTCLFGGEHEYLLRLLDRAEALVPHVGTYEEHSVNLALQHMQDAINILPCQYATPSVWHCWPPSYKHSYAARATGLPKILHHNACTYAPCQASS